MITRRSSWFCFFLCLLILVAVCRSKAVAEEVVSRVEVVGNDTIPTQTILLHSPIKTGEPIDADKTSQTIKQLFSLNFFENITISTRREEEKMVVTIEVVEYPTAAGISITGNKAVKDEDLLDEFPFSRGDFVSPEDVEGGRLAIIDKYQQKGFFLVDVSSASSIVKPGMVEVEYQVAEKEKIRIESISFPGLCHTEPEKLKKIMMTKEKNFLSWLTMRGNLVSEVLDEDIEKIRNYLLDLGFARVKVGSPVIALTTDEKGLTIDIPIDEGSLYTIGSVQFSETYEIPGEELEKEFPLKPGVLFSRSLLMKGIQKVVTRYNLLGYAFAQAIPRVTVDDYRKTVDITMIIEPNGKTVIRRIDIVGNTKTRDWVIRRELKLQEGGLFAVDKLAESQRLIANLGFFDDLSFEPTRTPDEKMDLVIKVHEKPTGAFSMGLAYSSIDGLVGTLQLSESNFRGKGQTLSLSAEYGSESTEYSLYFQEPYLFGRELSFGFKIYDNIREYDTYDRQKIGMSLSIGKKLFRNFVVQIGFTDETLEIYNIDEDASELVVEAEGTTRTKSLATSLIWDMRDNRFDPTRGQRQVLSVESAGGFLGGDNYFTRYQYQSSWYYRLIRSLVLVLNGKIGYIEPFDHKPLPFDERFFTGGIYTIRGFENREVGPKDEAGNPLGGDKLLLFNAELVFPLAEDQGIKGVFFFDAGSVFLEDDDYNIADFRTGAGAGIRWYTPVGPLRLEWGKNLEPEGDEDDSRWHFSIGAFF